LPVPRSDNRQAELLDAAAHRFAQRGYAASTMREIAVGAQMKPGSLYYHFPSKEHLLVAVYEAGVQQLEDALAAATAAVAEPWARLEAACTAHLETLLRDSDYAQVLIRVLPQDVPLVAERLGALRSRYEERWQALVRALPLPPRTDRGTLRRMLLGALNWSHFWFVPTGTDSPRQLARKFVAFLKERHDV
jgi:TetR/AcrR family transcriptional regulator, cholesterol catabolism regulator